MPYPDPSQQDHPWSALHCIADAVGYPLEPSQDERSIEADEAGDTLALMRLWVAITDGPGRDRVIGIARQEAARCACGERA